MQDDSVIAAALAVRERFGKGLIRQFIEAVDLRFGPSRLGISDYYFLRVFDPRLSRAQRRTFTGFRVERRLDNVFNHHHWHAVVNDKLLSYWTLESLGIPYPKLKALYSPLPRVLKGARLLSSRSDVADFCRAPSSYPMFMKPLHGSFGRGACSGIGYEPSSDSIVLGNGTRWPVDEAVESFLQPNCFGYLFQELIRPHDGLRELCGSTVSSARVVVLRGGRAPRIWGVVWRIPQGNSMVDNFHRGLTGNLAALVDPNTGVVQRVISGSGPSMEDVECHPDTGGRLKGIQLPHWDRVREICLLGGAAYHRLRFQHWDIALTNDGPVALEVNVDGGLNLHQLTRGSGALDDPLREALADVGADPWANARRS